MALTDKFSAVGKYFQTLLEESDLPFVDVYYGDQAVIINTPVVCVATGEAVSDGATNRLDHEFNVYFLIYHGKIQDTQDNQLECDVLAEDLRDLLHIDPSAGGNVIHGWVTEMEPGFAMRNDSLMRMHRVTWRGKTRTINPFGV